MHFPLHKIKISKMNEFSNPLQRFLAKNYVIWKREDHYREKERRRWYLEMSRAIFSTSTFPGS